MTYTYSIKLSDGQEIKVMEASMFATVSLSNQFVTLSKYELRRLIENLNETLGELENSSDKQQELF